MKRAGWFLAIGFPVLFFGFVSVNLGHAAVSPGDGHAALIRSGGMRGHGLENMLFQDSNPAQGSESGEAEEKAHMDHKPKHGGTFFMSLDNKHHLEGVLLPPGTFRIYFYDDHTKPLKAEQVREASGSIQIGESEDAPKILLAPGKKKETMEAVLGTDVKFPVAITLLLHLPGMAADEKPELFNFTFTQFTDEHGAGTSAPMGKMPGMK